jgi:hypothetical protein
MIYRRKHDHKLCKNLNRLRVYFKGLTGFAQKVAFAQKSSDLHKTIVVAYFRFRVVAGKRSGKSISSSTSISIETPANRAYRRSTINEGSPVPCS